MSLSTFSKRANQLEPNKSTGHSRDHKERGIFCPFCKKNGELEAFYRSHKLHDENNQVCCPILKKYTCPKCQVTGDHTAGYCPKEPNNKKLDRSRRGSPNELSKKADHEPERQDYDRRRRPINSNTSSPAITNPDLNQQQSSMYLADRPEQPIPAAAYSGRDMNDVLTAYLVRRQLCTVFEDLISRIKTLRVANVVKTQLDVLDALIGELNK